MLNIYAPNLEDQSNQEKFWERIYQNLKLKEELRLSLEGLKCDNEWRNGQKTTNQQNISGSNKAKEHHEDARFNRFMEYSK